MIAPKPDGAADAILIVTDSLTGLGGTEHVTLLVAEELLRQGWRVAIVTAAYQPSRSPWAQQIASSHIRVYAPPVFLPWRWRLRERWLARQVLRASRTIEANTIWCSDNGAAACGLLAASPSPSFRIFVHDPGDGRRSNPAYLKKWYALAANATGITTHTVSQAERIREWCPHDLFVSPVGAACAAPVRMPSEACLDSAGPTLRFGHFGRVEPVKGHVTAILAFHRLAQMGIDAEYQIHGAGSQLQACREYVSHLGLADRVKFHGSFRPDDLDKLMEPIDVTLSSSLSEGFGLVLLEGMARARPFVSTSTDGALSILATVESGWVAPIGDVQALAQRMFECATNRAMVRESGRRAREHWQSHHTLYDMVEKLKSVWKIS